MKCILTLLRYTSISTTWAVHWKEEKSLQHDLFESTECLLEQTGIVSKTSTPITHANIPTHILTYISKYYGIFSIESTFNHNASLILFPTY